MERQLSEETDHVAGCDGPAVVPKNHVLPNVGYVARSVKFYAAFFGAKPHKGRLGYANFDVANPVPKLD